MGKNAVLEKVIMLQTPAVISLCAYRDLSGMFTTKYEEYADANSTLNQSYSGSGFGYMKPEPNNMKFEDEEDLLYGESGSSFKMKNVSEFLIFLVIRRNYWVIN